MDKSSQDPELLPQCSPTRPESSEPLIDENWNVTPRRSKAATTARQSAKRLFSYTPNYFRKRALQRDSDSEDELGTPRKLSKLAREDSTDWNAYLADDSTARRPLDNGDNNNKNVDKPRQKLKIECENFIYSQLSETSKRQLLGDSPMSTSREICDDPEMYSQSLSAPQKLSDPTQSPKLFVPSQSPIYEFLSPQLPGTPQTKKQYKKNDLRTNYSANYGTKVMDPLLKIRSNMENEKKLNDEALSNAFMREFQKIPFIESNAIINQQLNSSYTQCRPEYAIPSPLSSTESHDSMDSQKVVSPRKCFLHPLGKENRDNVYYQNHTTTPVINIFAVPNNSARNWRNENQHPCIFGRQVLSSNYAETPTNLDEATNLRHHPYERDVHLAFPGLNNFIKSPLIDHDSRDFNFQLSQSSVASPDMKDSQSEVTNNLSRLDSTSAIEVITLDDEEKLPISQLIPSDDVKIISSQPMTHDEEQPSSQQMSSPNVKEIFNAQVPVPQLKDSISEAKFLLDSETTDYSSTPCNIPTNEKEDLQCHGDIPNIEAMSSPGEANLLHEDNPSQSIQINFADVNDDPPGEDLATPSETFTLQSPEEEQSNLETVSSRDEDINNGNDVNARRDSPCISPNAENVRQENLSNDRDSSHFAEIPSQSTSSISPLATDNSENPWLNVTSQDFSQRHSIGNNYLTQDSGQVSLDSLASQRSFISLSSEESDDDAHHDRILSLREMLRVKSSTIQKNIDRIILWLENEY